MRKALSTFSFKFKIISFIGWLAVFILVFALAVKTLNFLYAADDNWSRKMFHSFYEQKQIDNVYIGSSHVYCDINPYILDKKNGQNNFNIATPNQRIIDSYFCLLEANRTTKIKKAYIELYYKPSTGVLGDYSQTDSRTIGYRVSDYSSKISPIRYKAIFAMNDKKHLTEAFSPFLRYRKYLFNPYHIKNQIDTKTSKQYKSFQYHNDFEDGNGYDEYLEKGRFISTRLLINSRIWNEDRLPEEMNITQAAQTYLQKIIDYCKQKDIELTLFISPVWATQLLATENYDSYIQSVSKIAANNDVPFYDFNLCKEEYLNLEKPDYWRDEGHLNIYGAEIYTNTFYDVISGKYENSSDVFHSSYQEKIKNITPQLYGAYMNNQRDDYLKRANLQGIIPAENEIPENKRFLHLAASGKNAFEYKVLLNVEERTEDTKSVEQEKTQLIQDFCSNSIVEIPIDTNGTCTVLYRLKDKPEEINTMEFEF